LVKPVTETTSEYEVQDELLSCQQLTLLIDGNKYRAIDSHLNDTVDQLFL